MLTLIAGSLGYRLLGVASGLACGRKRWQNTQTVAEGLGGPKEGCQAVRIVLRPLYNWGGGECARLKKPPGTHPLTPINH